MPDFKNPNYEYITDEKRLKEVVAKELKGKKMLAVDVEGTGLDPYLCELVLVQVGTSEKAYLIDAQKVSVEPLRGVFESREVLKILQNGKFDYGMIKAKFGIELINIFDTMLAERVLTAGLSRENSLGAIAQKYLELELDKDWESYDWEGVFRSGKFTKRHFKYAALDVLILFPILEKQFAALKKEGLVKIAQLEFAVLPVVAEMELRGSYIDVKKWRAHINELKEKRNEIAQKIQSEVRPLYRNHQVDLFGNQVDIINLNSQPQLMELFNDRLGLTVPSTGEAVLSRVNHPVAKMLLEYRGYAKLISAFGDNLLSKINPKTGRLHPDYMQIGADTGRFSCSNPNLQQIPSDSAFRSCFIALPGYKLVTGDYSQQELRILAELSGDPILVKAYHDGVDLHTLTASQMYGVPQDQVTKKMRAAAKNINFGLMYGRGAASLAAQLEVSVDEAKKLLNRYFKTYKKVKRWLDQVARNAVKNGYSTTLGGRRRHHRKPDPSDPNYDRQVAHIERQGKNTPIQGSAADMIKYALVYIYDRIRREKLEASIISTVHDEIVIEVRQDQAEQVKKIMSEEMVRAGKKLLKKVPIKAGVEISDIWEH